MTHDPRHRPDLPTLAASLRLWAAELVVWLVQMLGENALTRSLRAWLHDELGRLERGAETLAVMAALQLLPAPPPALRHTRRPLSAPPGFARVFIHSNEMRGVTRRLFPRERDLLRRARRLSAFLDALSAHAQRLTRRIARYRPVTRIAMIAPMAAPCAQQSIACVMVDDSS